MSKNRITLNKYSSSDEKFNWQRDAVVGVWYRKNPDNSVTTAPADEKLSDDENKVIVCETCQQTSMSTEWGSALDWGNADNVKCPSCNVTPYRKETTTCQI